MEELSLTTPNALDLAALMRFVVLPIATKRTLQIAGPGWVGIRYILRR